MTNTPARKSTELLRKRDALSQVRVSKRLQEALPGAAHRLEHKHGAAELVFCVDGTNSMGGILSLSLIHI